MAYIFYLDGIALPIPPSKLKMTAKNRNGVSTLISGEEVSILKSPGLTEISFDALLPQEKYPFAYYPDGFVPASFYLNKLQRLRDGKNPFQFIVSRLSPDDRLLFDTNIKVSLDDYSISEDASDGRDVTVSVRLREYKKFCLKIVQSNKKAGTSIKARDAKTSAKSYTVRKGDSLFNICKKELGDGSKCWAVAKLNGISNPNRIQVGQVIRFE
ncbi:MAG: LysM domain-containing protein [Oscillospiraceae bacterium]